MILIKRKSRRDWKVGGASGLVRLYYYISPGATNRQADTSAMDQSTADSGIVYEGGMDTGNRKKRKKSTVGFEGSILSNMDTSAPLRSRLSEQSNGANNGIRPFISIVSPETRKKDKKKRKRKDVSMEVADEVVAETRQPAPEPAPEPEPAPSKTTPGRTYRTSHPAIEQGQKHTYFLVSATSQLEIEPVWLPYQNFQTATAFLTTMAGELDLHEWNPTAQLNQEIALGAHENLVASVLFEWTDFGIRVRQGQDRDWEFVKRELERLWMAKHGQETEGEGESHPGRFIVRVMLHDR